MLEDGTTMSHHEVLQLGLTRFKGAPARRNKTWTVHGGDTFASLSRPQHKAKQEQARREELLGVQYAP